MQESAIGVPVLHEAQLTLLHSSRRPFMPEDHWHLSSQIDMNSFVEAAVYVPLLYVSS